MSQNEIDINSYTELFNAIKEAGLPSDGLSEPEQAVQDVQHYINRIHWNAAQTCLSHYFILTAKSQEFDKRDFVTKVLSLKNHFDSADEFNSALQISFRATSDDAKKIFGLKNGMQVYTTLIEDIGMPRLYAQEHAACNKMIDDYCKIIRREDGQCSQFRNDFSAIKKLLDYGLSVQYKDAFGYNQSHLAYALLSVAGRSMPQVYEYCPENTQDTKMREHNIEMQRTQWRLLDLFANPAYNPDWSYKFHEDSIVPDLSYSLAGYGWRDCAPKNIAGSNLLTCLFYDNNDNSYKSFLHPSLKPITKWIVEKSREKDGAVDLLNQVDGNDWHVFSALDKCRTLASNNFESEKATEGWHKDIEAIQKYERRVKAADEILSALLSLTDQVTNPTIRTYIDTRMRTTSIVAKQEPIKKRGFVVTMKEILKSIIH